MNGIKAGADIMAGDGGYSIGTTEECEKFRKERQGMSDRFDFEQQIMKCWNVCEDIDAIYRMSDIRAMSEDELANALLGLKTMYNLKFEVLFDMFESMIKEGKIK